MTSRTRGSARQTIALSDYKRDWMLQHTDLLPDEISVIPNYIADPGVRDKASAVAGSRRIGFVARDFEAKGGPLVLEAFKQLRRADSTLSLLIIGSPPRLTDAELDELGIVWLASVPWLELMSHWLPTVDIFAYPSQSDGSPYVLIEALAMGIPLIVSNYRALPEFTVNGAG